MPWRLGVLLAAIGTILFPVASLAKPTVPDVPKEIAVPPAHKLLFKVEGKGVQITRRWRASPARPSGFLRPRWLTSSSAKAARPGAITITPRHGRQRTEARS